MSLRVRWPPTNPVAPVINTLRDNGQIARELHITAQTVKTHVSNILNKLNSRSRTEAALHAMRLGLVPVHETAPH